VLASHSSQASSIFVPAAVTEGLKEAILNPKNRP
jgi:hypothetical protein